MRFPRRGSWRYTVWRFLECAAWLCAHPIWGWRAGAAGVGFPWWRSPAWVQAAIRRLDVEWELSPSELDWTHEAIAEYEASPDLAKGRHPKGRSALPG